MHKYLICDNIKMLKERGIMSKSLSLLVTAVAVAGCLTFGSVARAEEFTVAVVDVPQVVNASAQVQALKKDQQAKAEEIIKFVEKARKDVASITDETKKKAYTEKLKAIDTSISQQIINSAKADGYSIVLSKGVVLYGGDDITSQILKVVK